MKKNRNKKQAFRVKKGGLYLLSYEDAAYSYANTPQILRINPPQPTTTFGLVRRTTNSFVDIGILWANHKEKVIFWEGIVIPRKAIVKAIKLRESSQRVS